MEQFPAPEQVQVGSGTQTLACRVTWPPPGRPQVLECRPAFRRPGHDPHAASSVVRADPCSCGVTGHPRTDAVIIRRRSITCSPAAPEPNGWAVTRRAWRSHVSGNRDPASRGQPADLVHYME